jgi:magnesium chelatase family protein
MNWAMRKHVKPRRASTLEVTKIYSVSGQLSAGEPLISRRPFRAPHHTTSHAGLVGGGRWPRPGEITLAHRGVLFLDELPEFGQNTLEVLRQPLEDRIVTISRAQGTVTFPANFILIGAMNPCPCGYFGDATRECTCSPGVIARYQKRISGPLLDRIDIHVEAPRVDYEKLTDRDEAERSATVRELVRAARAIQARRFASAPRVTCNAEMGPAEVRAYCEVEPAAQPLLRAAMQRLQLSARLPPRPQTGAYHRRSGWSGDHRRATSGRGAAISPSRRRWMNRSDRLQDCIGLEMEGASEWHTSVSL